jgi:large subunit ribosomal protein L33
MAKKKRITTSMACEDCRERNYSQVVSGQRTAGSLKRSKYCAHCRKHTMHKETK